MRFAVAGVVAVFVAQGALANDLAGFRVEGMLGLDGPEGWLIGDAKGLLYGVGAGYDFALGESLALGIDGEIAGSTASQDYRVFGPGGTEQVYGEGTVGRDLYVGARLTGKVADRVAVYGKVGYSNAKVSARVFLPEFGPGREETRGGWRAGFGGQILWGKLYTGLEYRYTDYGSQGFANDNIRRHQLVGNVGVRF
jgi:outer membrane immunogenic protein